MLEDLLMHALDSEMHALDSEMPVNINLIALRTAKTT